jgi:hypothetical protein
MPDGIKIALHGIICSAICLVSMAFVDQTQRVLFGYAHLAAALQGVFG